MPLVNVLFKEERFWGSGLALDLGYKMSYVTRSGPSKAEDLTTLKGLVLSLMDPASWCDEETLLTARLNVTLTICPHLLS